MRRAHGKKLTGLVALAAAVGAMALPALTIDSASAAGTHAHDVITTVKEIHVSVDGESTSPVLTVTCPTDYYAVDGGFLLDAVDPVGSVADIQVLTSQPSPDLKSWTLKIRNDTQQRAQGKGKVVCLSATTTKAQEHTHSVAAPTLAYTTPNPYSWGGPSQPWSEYVATATCPSGQLAVAPVWDFTAGSGFVTESALSGPTMTMTMVANEASTMYGGVVCLNPALTGGTGTQQYLTFTTKSGSIGVGANSRADETVTCDNSGIGIGSSFVSEPGLLSMGNNPQGNSRMFRFYNDTDDPASATLSLLCLGGKTGSTVEPLVIDIGPVAYRATSGKRIVVGIACSQDCNVKVVVKSNVAFGDVTVGKTVAYGKARLDGATGFQWVRLDVKKKFWEEVAGSNFYATVHATAPGASDSHVLLIQT